MAKQMKSETVRRLAAVALFMAAGVVFGGAARAANENLLEGLPDNLKSLYEGDTGNLQPSAYDNFKMPAPPWKWCHSESYQGNPWRVALTNELRRLVDVYKAAGKVSDFELSDSNGDTSRQIAQIRAFIDKKCSIITTVAGSATGLNDAIEAAYKAGIPIVTISSSVTSPDAINVNSNYERWGFDMASAIVKDLGGKGNALMVEGIAGAPIVALERAGAEKGFKGTEIKEVRSVNGNWTANVTKTVVLQALATTPQKIDAVWTTGSETSRRGGGLRRGQAAAAVDHGIDLGRRARLLEGASGRLSLRRPGGLARLERAVAVSGLGAAARGAAAQAGDPADPNSGRASG